MLWMFEREKINEKLELLSFEKAWDKIEIDIYDYAPIQITPSIDPVLDIQTGF